MCDSRKFGRESTLCTTTGSSSAFKTKSLTVSRGCKCGYIAGARSWMAVSASYWTVQRRLLGELISCWNGTSAMELPEGEWRVRSQSYGTAQRTDFSRSACTCPQAVLEGSRLGMLQAVKKIVTVLLSPQHHPYKEVSRAISDLSLRRHF